MSGEEQLGNEPGPSIAAGRGTIDEIDSEICRLIQRRREVSVGLQQARIAAGETRISHARENQVIAAYSERLGKRGVTICLAVLELCRGSATSAR